jgi:hypothetical protein
MATTMCAKVETLQEHTTLQLFVLEFDTCFCGHGHQNQHRNNNKCCSDYYHTHKQFYTRGSIFDNYNNQ